MPLTVPALGKLTTIPPGQCARVPGRSVQPQTPTVVAQRVNVEGTGNVLELYTTCERLERLVYVSTAYVSGLRTGTVYETELVGFESWGSIASGGRYDSLASDGRISYPGVGLSIGVTRLLAPLFAKGMLRASRPVPTAVLVSVDSEETRATAIEVAEQLRTRGIPTEVAPRAEKYGRQIRYADRRGIPFVWFGGTVGGEVKDIRSGEQVSADPASWMPSAEDLKPVVLSLTPSC